MLNMVFTEQYWVICVIKVKWLSVSCSTERGNWYRSWLKCLWVNRHWRDWAQWQHSRKCLRALWIFCEAIDQTVTEHFKRNLKFQAILLIIVIINLLEASSHWENITTNTSEKLHLFPAGCRGKGLSACLQRCPSGCEPTGRKGHNKYFHPSIHSHWIAFEWAAERPFDKEESTQKRRHS